MGSKFINNLWRIVEVENNDEFINWSEDGKSFKIKNTSRFEKEVLPLYFKHSNMLSFFRQLNWYRFSKFKIERENVVQVYHPNFQRGKIENLNLIKRKKSKCKENNVTKRKAPSLMIDSNRKILKKNNSGFATSPGVSNSITNITELEENFYLDPPMQAPFNSILLQEAGNNFLNNDMDKIRRNGSIDASLNISGADSRSDRVENISTKSRDLKTTSNQMSEIIEVAAEESTEVDLISNNESDNASDINNQNERETVGKGNLFNFSNIPIPSISNESIDESKDISDADFNFIYDQSSYVSGITTEISREVVFFLEALNPFEPSLKNRLLNSLTCPIEHRRGFAWVWGSLPDLSAIGTPITLQHGKRCMPVDCIQQVGKSVSMFAVWQCDTDDLDARITLHSAKRCVDGSGWDFYIRDELQRRFLRAVDRRRNFSLSIMPMYKTIFFNNGYIALHHDDMIGGNLRKALDFYRQTGQTFPEILIKYFMLELMLIIQKFHDCQIIHANVCAENIFLFNEPPAKEWLGKQIQVLRFCDFSDAIDMSLLPDGTFFSKNFTKNKSTKILNTKNWTHLIDWLGFVNCVHQMYFGCEMKLVCENKKWATMKRFELPERQYMNELFSELLNFEINQKPNINSFIEDLLKAVTEAYNDLLMEFCFFSFRSLI